MNKALKAEQWQELLDSLLAIWAIYETEFESASPPTAPPAAPVDEVAIFRHHEEKTLRGIGRLHRRARDEAREQAHLEAQDEMAAELAKRQLEHETAQRELDSQWEALLSNDPDTILDVATEAFADNETHAAIVGIDGDEVTLVMAAPTIDVIPDRMPGRTPSGKLSIKAMSKTDQVTLYREFIFGHFLNTVKETFAVLPSIDTLKAIVVRKNPDHVFDCIVAAGFQRTTLLDAGPCESAHGLLQESAFALTLNLKGQTDELGPIDLSDQPELRGVMDHLEYASTDE